MTKKTKALLIFIAFCIGAILAAVVLGLVLSFELNAINSVIGNLAFLTPAILAPKIIMLFLSLLVINLFLCVCVGLIVTFTISALEYYKDNREYFLHDKK